MLYNEVNRCAILIDAKSSISDRAKGSIIDDVVEASTVALSHKDKLESFARSKIDKLEFAILTFAYFADSIKQLVKEKNASVCIWSFHVVPGCIQLVRNGEDTRAEQLAGRSHVDEILRQALVKAIPTRMGALRSLPIMPSSHMFCKIEYIGQELFNGLDRSMTEDKSFGFSEVFSFCKQAFSTTELNEAQIENQTKQIIEASIESGLFRKLNEELEPSSMKLEISYGRRNYEKFKEDYLVKKCEAKAFSQALEEFKESHGFTRIDQY
jgi:hypothetical protein